VGLKAQVVNTIDDLILEKSGKPTSFYSLKRIVPTLNNKILWVHDQNDKITPLSDVQPLIDQHPRNVEFVITNGLGHSRIYKEEKVIDRVVDFLNT
jgi:pimeloyl-ACP methyl ester carboxylesterase